MLKQLGHSEEAVLEKVSGLKVKATMREQFAAKASPLLERKNELDQVVYSLLRLKSRFWPRSSTSRSSRESRICGSGQALCGRS